VREKMAIRTPEDGGKSAVTFYEVLERFRDFALVRCKPQTGRTHQIRIHLAALGAPLLGDRQYGGKSDRPLHLLARRVAVPLYPKKPPIAAEAPVPDHMRAALTRCGWTG
jgi:23S rRNA-/tRNA-specific pseudouridylate synthase